MDVEILRAASDVDSFSADIVADQIQRRQESVLGVATGSSPLGTYRELARRQDEGGLDLSGLTCFALDEYVGLPYGHSAAYASVLESVITLPFGLPRSRVRAPDGTRPDLLDACRDYEREIETAGGVELQILGIGANGHIGFNEPTSSLASRTRVKALSAQTRVDNARFFDDPREVPTHCLTQGLGTILEADRVVLIAQGVRKAEAVAAAIEGPVSAMCPASALQLHKDVTVVLDEAAASRLSLGDYYRFASQAKRKFSLEGE